MSRRFAALLVCFAIIFALSTVDAATSRIKVRSSPLGRHIHTHEHHVGKVRGSCSSPSGAAQFGARAAGMCPCGCGQIGCTCGQ